MMERLGFDNGPTKSNQFKLTQENIDANYTRLGVESGVTNSLKASSPGITLLSQVAINHMANAASGCTPQVGAVGRTGHPTLSTIDFDAMRALKHGDELVATLKASQRSRAKRIRHSYVNNGHHVPVDDPRRTPDMVPYNNSKSVLPENHQQLFEMSILHVTEEKGKVHMTRWAFEGKGKNAVFYRFFTENNQDFHFSGSTHGKDAFGTSRTIKMSVVPKSIRDLARE